MISSCYEHEENVLRDRVSQFVLDLDSTAYQRGAQTDAYCNC